MTSGSYQSNYTGMRKHAKQLNQLKLLQKKMEKHVSDIKQ
jgi:hypothetical protein